MFPGVSAAGPPRAAVFIERPIDIIYRPVDVIHRLPINTALAMR